MSGLSSIASHDAGTYIDDGGGPQTRSTSTCGWLTAISRLRETRISTEIISPDVTGRCPGISGIRGLFSAE